MDYLMVFVAGGVCSAVLLAFVRNHICDNCLGEGILGCARIVSDGEGGFIRSDWTETCPVCKGRRFVWKQQRSRPEIFTEDGTPIEGATPDE